MAEQFLTLMADLDDEAQARLSGWYRSLQEAGFTGVQTPGLPYHISLSTFPLKQEEEAAGIARKAAADFAPVPVHFSHIGMFAGGKILFAAPEKDPELTALQEVCGSDARAGNRLCGASDDCEIFCSVHSPDYPAAFVRILADAGDRIL